MKNPPSKVAYISLIEKKNQYCQKRPGLPRQLKTRIALSMFPILDTNLWFKIRLVQYLPFALSCLRLPAKMTAEIFGPCDLLCSWPMLHKQIGTQLCVHSSQLWPGNMVIRVVKFSSFLKLERFSSKNQHTQKKLLNFENWCSGEVSKSAKI